MRIETNVRTLYTYGELSPTAKARARDWYREGSAGDNYFAEHVTGEFLEALTALGFAVDPHRGVAWCGFSSQGDGASFNGTWSARRFDPAALLADRPEDTELHRIAAELAACKDAGASWVEVERSAWGHSMGLAEHEWHDDTAPELDAEALHEYEDRFLEAARDLARHFYEALEAEYTYQNSDEVVAETIVANEYEFTEAGERA